MIQAGGHAGARAWPISGCFSRVRPSERILAGIASDQVRLRAADRQLCGAAEAISQKPWH